LSKAKEKAMFAVCISQRDQIYKSMILGLDDNDGITPMHYNDRTNVINPKWAVDDWLGASRSNSGKLINGVIGNYIEEYKKLARCPSLAKGTTGDGKLSNGYFDYTFPHAFARIQLARIETSGTWSGRGVSIPWVIEEDPLNVNGSNIESAFSNVDYLGSWHDDGVKGGYTAIDGSSVIMRNHTNTFKAQNILLRVEGVDKSLSGPGSIFTWPRGF
jgi:hypothetical protein